MDNRKMKDTAAGRTALARPINDKVGLEAGDDPVTAAAKIIRFTRENHPELEATFRSRLPEGLEELVDKMLEGG